MSKKEYKLQILPLFEEDLNEIADYITFKLKVNRLIPINLQMIDSLFIGNFFFSLC